MKELDEVLEVLHGIKDVSEFRWGIDVSDCLDRLSIFMKELPTLISKIETASKELDNRYDEISGLIIHSECLEKEIEELEQVVRKDG